MSTVICYSLPFTSHIDPMLPVISALVQRGEKIFFYATEEFRAKVEHIGAEFRAYDQFDFTNVPLVDNPIKLSASYLGPLLEVMEKCWPEAREIQPSYIIHDTHATWGAFIARLLKVPSIGSQTTLLMQSKMILAHPSMLIRTLRLFRNARAEVKTLQETLNTVTDTYQLPRQSLIETLHNEGDLTLVYTSRDFQPMAQHFGEKFVFVGPLLEERQEQVDFPFEKLDDRPLIYIAFGTIFNKRADFYRTCIEAFCNMDYQVVLSIGHSTQMEELGDIPANFLVSQYVPQLQILPRTSLFISHGGMNSTLEAVWHGVPLLLFPPTSADQFWVALHVEQSGVGKAYRKPHITAAQLRALVKKTLVRPGYAQASKHMGESLRTAGGLSKALAAIEEWKLRNHIGESTYNDTRKVWTGR